MGFVAKGFKLVYGNSRFWPYVWRPLFISILIFALVFALGYATIVPWVTGAATQFGLNQGVGSTLVTILYLVIWFYVAGGLYSTLAITLSAFTWERLSDQIELHVYGESPFMKHSMPRIAVDSGVRMIHAFCILCTGALLSSVPFLSIIFMAWLSMHDFTAPALLRRGVFFMHQTSKVVRCKGWLPFALCAGVLMMIPIVNLFSLPALVAAGTLLVAKAEH